MKTKTSTRPLQRSQEHAHWTTCRLQPTQNKNMVQNQPTLYSQSAMSTKSIRGRVNQHLIPNLQCKNKSIRGRGNSFQHNHQVRSQQKSAHLTTTILLMRSITLLMEFLFSPATPHTNSKHSTTTMGWQHCCTTTLVDPHQKSLIRNQMANSDPHQNHLECSLRRRREAIQRPRRFVKPISQPNPLAKHCQSFCWICQPQRS